MRDAKVPVLDRGFLYGDAVFDTMRSYAGVIFKPDEHIQRLLRGLSALGIKKPHSAAWFKNIVYRSLAINRLKNAYIRVTVTRGEGAFNIGRKNINKPNVVIIVKEFEGYPDSAYDKGISACIVPIRQDERSPVAGIKTANYLPQILSRYHAQKNGYDEAILRNIKGNVVEASTSNIFLVKSGIITTPGLDSGLLGGITRGTVIGIIKKLRLGFAEKKISPRQLISADEIFLTNSLIEILPVVRIGSKKIGPGRPGEITKLVRISYQKEVAREVMGSL
jgi:branched-chain amino acid aminotransferase